VGPHPAQPRPHAGAERGGPLSLVRARVAKGRADVFEGLAARHGKKGPRPNRSIPGVGPPEKHVHARPRGSALLPSDGRPLRGEEVGISDMSHASRMAGHQREGRIGERIVRRDPLLGVDQPPRTVGKRTDRQHV